MSESKNCMNCQHRVGGRNECLLNVGMRVNKRMVCEEWRSDDLGGAAMLSQHTGQRAGLGAVGVGEMIHEKVK